MNAINLMAEDAGEGAVGMTVEGLRPLFKKLSSAQEQVERYEEMLKAAKENLNKLETEIIPAAMRAAKIKLYEDDEGKRYELKPFMQCSLPSQRKVADEKDEDIQAELAMRRQEGLIWLRENNGESIIANEIIIEVKKGNDNAATSIIQAAREMGLDVERAESVHPMTLQSFLKEKRKGGTNIPAETFGLFEGEKVKVKKQKEKL